MPKSAIFCILLLCVAGIHATVADAQAMRVGMPRPAAQIPLGWLSVSASPAAVDFNLVPSGVAAGSSSIAVTMTWGGSLCLFACTISVYAYFASATAALSGGSPPVNIPSSEVRGQVPTGTPTTFTPFTQTGPLGGAGATLTLYKQTFIILTLGGSRTDALNLEINLVNQPQLPAGTYTGTLYIQAQSL